VSRVGRSAAAARRDGRVKRGELFATFHTPAAHVNRLLGPHRDNKVNTPAYKRTAVRLEKLPASAARVRKPAATNGTRVNGAAAG
jgi:formate dehydrogenase major subunit